MITLFFNGLRTVCYQEFSSDVGVLGHWSDVNALSVPHQSDSLGRLAPTNGFCETLLHAHIQGQQCRWHLLEEISFGFGGYQCVDLLSLSIRVGKDF